MLNGSLLLVTVLLRPEPERRDSYRSWASPYYSKPHACGRAVAAEWVRTSR